MILVTGGSGFLGQALTKRLLGGGDKVRLLDIQGPEAIPEGCEFFRCDIRDALKVQEACRGCSIVFHLVGIMPQARAPKDVMYSVNVGGTSNVLEGAARAGARRVVFLSSSEVYGFPEKIPIKEEDRKAPIGEYGRNKVEAEGLCLDSMRSSGIEVVMLRPSTIVGPGITERLFLKFLDLASRDRPLFYLGRGENRFQMTALGDCVEACLLAGGKEGVSGEAFNIGADGTMAMKEQILELKARAGIRSRVYSLPAKPAKFILSLLHPLGLSPLEPDHFHLADQDYMMDCTKAGTLLGWTPRQTNIGMIVETFEWYKDTRQRSMT